MASSSSTPRRSPRIAAKCRGNKSGTVITPVRNTLRSFIIHKEGARGSCQPMPILDCLKQFVEEEGYSSLMVVLARADVGGNKVKQFVVISRKLKCYDDQLGPYDALRLVVSEDCKYRLLGYGKTLEENLLVLPLSSSCIIQSLDKLADDSWTACPGIQGYTTYKESIGFDLDRVMIRNSLPDSACDKECMILFQRSPTNKSPMCAKCSSLKWLLAKRKRTHDGWTPSQRAQRQSSSSHVPFDGLSPTSKKARFESMSKTIKSLQFKAKYYSAKVERLSTNEFQNEEIGKLVDSIINSEDGCRQLNEIFSEADGVNTELGDVVKEIWEDDR